MVCAFASLRPILAPQCLKNEINNPPRDGRVRAKIGRSNLRCDRYRKVLTTRWALSHLGEFRDASRSNVFSSSSDRRTAARGFTRWNTNLRPCGSSQNQTSGDRRLSQNVIVMPVNAGVNWDEFWCHVAVDWDPAERRVLFCVPSNCSPWHPQSYNRVLDSMRRHSRPGRRVRR